jgi:predicted CoA-binding protein
LEKAFVASIKCNYLVIPVNPTLSKWIIEEVKALPNIWEFDFGNTLPAVAE